MNVIAQTYIYRAEGQCFFVSTINRESSAALAYGATYAETMAWEFDRTTNTRGHLVAMDEAATDSIVGHIRVCEALHKHGSVDNDDTQLPPEAAAVGAGLDPESIEQGEPA